MNDRSGYRCSSVKIVAKAYFLCWIMLILSCSVAWSETNEESFEVRDMIFSSCFVDGKTGWAIGNRGLILKTEDGAQTWSRQEKITDAALYDITFKKERGWIVGESGIVLHTRNGGELWQVQRERIEGEASLMKASFYDDRHGLAIGEGGMVVYTEDGGQSWENRSPDIMSILPDSLLERGITAVNFYALYTMNTSQVWIVGDSGIVMYSESAGKEWDVLRIGALPTLFSVLFVDEAEGFAAGQRGVLLHTEDGGRSWEEVESHTEENLYDIAMNGGDGIVSGRKRNGSGQQ